MPPTSETYRSLWLHLANKLTNASQSELTNAVLQSPDFPSVTEHRGAYRAYQTILAFMTSLESESGVDPRGAVARSTPPEDDLDT